MTQSLGGTISRRPLEPHIQRIAMPDDAKILLCSDGLTDMLSDDEIAGILIRHPDNPCEKLVSAALDAGGNDNITVVVIGTSKSRGKPF